MIYKELLSSVSEPLSALFRKAHSLQTVGMLFNEGCHSLKRQTSCVSKFVRCENILYANCV